MERNLIEDCNFSSSGTRNVQVQDYGTVTVRRSTFVQVFNNPNFGSANGLEVFDTAKLVVEQSEFRNSGGYGLYTQWNSTRSDFGMASQEIQIHVSRQWVRHFVFQPGPFATTRDYQQRL